MTQHAQLASLWLLLAATLSSPALAQNAPQTTSPALPLWELGLGAGVLSLPHYRGSDQSHTWLLPAPYVVYRGTWLKADRDGTRAVLLDTDRLELNLSLAASAPTRSQDNRARAGMADLSPTLELGPHLNAHLAQGTGWQLDLRLPVRAVMTVTRSPRFIGWSANPHLNLDRQLGSWNLGLQAGPVFGDRRLHAYFYDVGGADATASRPAYQAAGGQAGWQAIAALSQRHGALWWGAFVKADSLQNAAFVDSPLVRRRQSWSGGLALSWIFARSAQAAPDQP
jgi:MipA family protein